jgi:hypothetical protein
MGRDHPAPSLASRVDRNGATGSFAWAVLRWEEACGSISPCPVALLRVVAYLPVPCHAWVRWPSRFHSVIVGRNLIAVSRRCAGGHRACRAEERRCGLARFAVVQGGEERYVEELDGYHSGAAAPDAARPGARARLAAQQVEVGVWVLARYQPPILPTV